MSWHLVLFPQSLPLSFRIGHKPGVFFRVTLLSITNYKRIFLTDYLPQFLPCAPSWTLSQDLTSRQAETLAPSYFVVGDLALNGQSYAGAFFLRLRWRSVTTFVQCRYTLLHNIVQTNLTQSHSLMIVISSHVHDCLIQPTIWTPEGKVFAQVSKSSGGPSRTWYCLWSMELIKEVSSLG